MKFPTYDSLLTKILKGSENDKFKKVKVSKNDKFILKLVNHNINDLDSFWNSETYDFFLSKIKKDLPSKIKIHIEKVKKYPAWNPPQFYTILKNSLNSAWDATKKDLEEQLTENYLIEGKKIFIQEAKEKIENFKEKFFHEIHANIVCNNCLNSNFQGTRYICGECDNYNLCQFCYKCLENKKFRHNPDHFFIKMNIPVILDIQKYNCIFTPNKIFLRKKDKQLFDLKINIVNIGENDLLECFLSPVRFGQK
jgi:hypothetical protein